MKLTTNQKKLLNDIWLEAKQYVKDNKTSIGLPLTVEDVDISIDSEEKRVVNQLIKKNLLEADYDEFGWGTCYLTHAGAKFCYENL